MTFAQRLVGATMLDADVYEDLEANPSATWQAALVVLLSSLAAGVGTGGADSRRARSSSARRWVRRLGIVGGTDLPAGHPATARAADTIQRG